MSFSRENVTKIIAGLKAVGGDMFAAKDVSLYQGATVQVRYAVGTRSAGQSDLTGGVLQETTMVATIEADDWDAKVGRAPFRGDKLHVGGVTYMVEQAHKSQPAGVAAFYKARLSG